jgi:hypothetical protein
VLGFALALAEPEFADAAFDDSALEDPDDALEGDLASAELLLLMD